MKTMRILTLLMLAGLLLFGLTGCSDNPTTTQQVGVDDYEQMDLDAPDGGLTATDEQPAFGEEYLLQADLEDADAESDDPLQADAEVQQYEQMVDDPAADPDDPSRPRITALRLTWGQLDGSIEDIDEPFDVLDWSGMLRVDRGILVVRRVILFERPRDHLVFPRIDRRTVAWVSHTGPHYDGLLVEVIEPPVADQDSNAVDMPNMIHFTTPQLTLDIPVAELDGLDRLVEVDDQGNGVQLLGHRLGAEDLCPKGFLAGLWRSAPTDSVPEGGFFMGRWVDIWGHLRGYLRGRYGIDSSGERVLFGKYIDPRGHFRGLIRGTYVPGPEVGHGTFRGEWINAAATVEGVLGGEYVALPDRPAGFFSGRWATLCDDQAVASITDR